MAGYSPIKKEDVAVLEKNGCVADDWSKVSTGAGFNPARVAGCVFKGEVKIGKLEGKIDLKDGVDRACGVYRAKLSNVTLGDNCYVADVKGWISNYDIADNVVIENVGDIKCTGETTFGNGNAIEVYNEGGGRELKITDKTSSQIAYMSVMYRDKKNLVAALDKIADGYAATVKSSRGSIGKGSKVVNSVTIKNVRIGEAAKINGAQCLEEGTVNSTEEAPSEVGNGVVAEHFIMQVGSSVKEGAMIFLSIVGEGTKIGEQFSAKASVFFANCEGFHSEACSAFCGPYAVSHHRSTLLIAGLYSFFNAGSGTNQSNHMYKLGPIHQGILERGSKTGSFSYLLWPSKVGAFTAVIGKHYANFDSSDLPFSYITEEEGNTIITPAMNFFTVGTLRDGEKWPKRDRRKNKKKLDQLIFDVLSPYTGQKMINAIRILSDLYAKADKSEKFVKHNGILIKRVLLNTNKKYYELAMSKLIGDMLLTRVNKTGAKKMADALKADPAGTDGKSDWLDIGGLLCDRSRLNALIADVEGGKIKDIDALQTAIEKIHASYDADAWNWLLNAYKNFKGKELKDDVAAAIDAWKEASLKLVDMVLGDAKKEFEGNTRTGFGIDGNQDEDFAAVRGTMETNKFVKGLVESKKTTEDNAAKMKGML